VRWVSHLARHPYFADESEALDAGALMAAFDAWAWNLKNLRGARA
jgi:hypothetical protein